MKQVLAVGLASLAMVSLLALAFYSFAVTSGVYLMLSSSALGSLPILLATGSLAVLGTLATLCALIASFLQLRRARPLFLRLTGLMTASFHCSLFLFVCICFLIVDIKTLLPGSYVAGQIAIMGQVLLKSLCVTAILMLLPLLRNRYAQVAPSL